MHPKRCLSKLKRRTVFCKHKRGRAEAMRLVYRFGHFSHKANKPLICLKEICGYGAKNRVKSDRSFS